MDDWVDIAPSAAPSGVDDWQDDWQDVAPSPIAPPTGPRAAGAMSGYLGGVASLGDLASLAAKYNPFNPNFLADQVMPSAPGPDYAPGAGDYLRQAFDAATGIKNSTKINEGNIEHTIGSYIAPGMIAGPEKVAQNLALSVTSGLGDWLGAKATPAVAKWSGANPEQLEPFMRLGGAVLAPQTAYKTLTGLKSAGAGLQKLSSEIRPLTPVEQTVADLGIPKSEFTKSAKTAGPYTTEEVPLVTTLENLKARGAFNSSDPNDIIKWNRSEISRLGDEVKDYLGKIDIKGVKPEIDFANTRAFIAKNENQAEQLGAQLERRMEVFGKRWNGTAKGLDLRKKALTRIAYKKDTESVVQGLDKALASDYRVALERAAEKAFPGEGAERLIRLNAGQGDNLALNKLLTKKKGADAAAKVNKTKRTFGQATADWLDKGAAFSIVPALGSGNFGIAATSAGYLGAKALANTKAGQSVISGALGKAGRAASKVGSFADNLNFSKPFINKVKPTPALKEDVLKAIGWTGQIDQDFKLPNLELGATQDLGRKALPWDGVYKQPGGSPPNLTLPSGQNLERKALPWDGVFKQEGGVAQKGLPAPLQHPEAGVYQRMLPAVQKAKKAGEVLPGYPDLSEISKDIIKITNLPPEKAKVAAQAYKEMVDNRLMAQMEAKVGSAKSSEKWNPKTGKFATPEDKDPSRGSVAGRRYDSGKGEIRALAALAGGGYVANSLISGAKENNERFGRVSGLSPAFGSISRPKSAKKNATTNGVTMSASSDKIAAKIRDSMIHQESRGKPNAVSPKGAVGLMQLMPETGKEWHKKLGITEPYNPKNPEQNKKIGTAYISWLIDQFDNDVELALTAYNQGIGRVKRLLKRVGGSSLDDIKKYLGRDGKKYAEEILSRVNDDTTMKG